MGDTACNISEGQGRGGKGMHLAQQSAGELLLTVPTSPWPMPVSVFMAPQSAGMGGPGGGTGGNGLGGLHAQSTLPVFTFESYVALVTPQRLLKDRVKVPGGPSVESPAEYGVRK